MREDFTDITFLLDRTGSMFTKLKQTVDGYNEFLGAQKFGPGTANITLIQFDSRDPHEVVYADHNVNDVGMMEYKDFLPRDYTPLFDAICMAIVNRGEKYAAMEERDRPGKVVFVVLTDGEENHSREYTLTQTRRMITEQTDKYGWNFIFLGADIDAIAEGGRIGTQYASTMSTNSEKITSALRETGAKVAKYRSSGARSDLAYTVGDRKKHSGDT